MRLIDLSKATDARNCFITALRKSVVDENAKVKKNICYLIMLQDVAERRDWMELNIEVMDTAVMLLGQMPN